MTTLLALIASFVLKFPGLVAFLGVLTIPLLILAARITTGLPLKFLNFLDPTRWTALGVELLANLIGLIWPPAATAYNTIEGVLYNSAVVVSVACAPIMAPAVSLQLIIFLFNVLLTAFAIRVFRAVWGKTR